MAGRTIETSRLRTHYAIGGTEDGVPVVFVHGNVSSSVFFEDTLAALPDLRGGGTKDVSGTPCWSDYAATGGVYREEVIPDCGHSPHVEKPEEFRRLLFEFLGATGGRGA